MKAIMTAGLAVGLVLWALVFLLAPVWLLKLIMEALIG